MFTDSLSKRRTSKKRQTSEWRTTGHAIDFQLPMSCSASRLEPCFKATMSDMDIPSLYQIFIINVPAVISEKQFRYQVYVLCLLDITLVF